MSGAKPEKTWADLRAKAREKLAGEVDGLMDTAIEKAKGTSEKGDARTLRLLLGPLLDVRQVQLSDPDGGQVTFAWLAQEARRDRRNEEGGRVGPQEPSTRSEGT